MTTDGDGRGGASPKASVRDGAPAHNATKAHRRVVPVLITFCVVALASALGYAMWQAYMTTPWTRDGRVRVYVVTIAPEVAGRIVELPVSDNQFVHKNDLLMVIDPTDYTIAVQLEQAALDQANAEWQNKRTEAARREKLTTLSTSVEEQQIYASNALSAQAVYQQALANLDRAKVNLERTRIRSPVNGYVTNLLAQLGNYAKVGETTISVIDADSFWVDGYFEETNLRSIRDGDPAKIKLLGSNEVMLGHVDGIARGISNANVDPDSAGLASVNPIFTWVRLAQRVPVHIRIDKPPSDVPLVAGMTGTVQIDPQSSPRATASSKPPNSAAPLN
ncbi:MAG: HlyD family secretion protein [Methylocella sp.]